MKLQQLRNICSPIPLKTKQNKTKTPTKQDISSLSK
jgi:hypothetical protein